MLLCKDCKHCIRPARWKIPSWRHLIPLIGQVALLVDYFGFRDCQWEFARCGANRRVKEPDYVSGAKNTEYAYCSLTRQFGHCGPDAVLFEAK